MFSAEINMRNCHNLFTGIVECIRYFTINVENCNITVSVMYNFSFLRITNIQRHSILH